MSPISPRKRKRFQEAEKVPGILFSLLLAQIRSGKGSRNPFQSPSCANSSRRRDRKGPSLIAAVTNLCDREIRPPRRVNPPPASRPRARSAVAESTGPEFRPGRRGPGRRGDDRSELHTRKGEAGEVLPKQRPGLHDFIQVTHAANSLPEHDLAPGDLFDRNERVHPLCYVGREQREGPAMADASPGTRAAST